MRYHPGGAEQTRELLKTAALPSGALLLDMGAGAGEALRIAREMGLSAVGVDRDPLSEDVIEADFLDESFLRDVAPHEACFDAVLSQCAFYISGNQKKAILQAKRALRPGGLLLLADLFAEDAGSLLLSSGFEILHRRDITPLWRAYFLEALWRDELPSCLPAPGTKISYQLLICRKVVSS